MNLTWFNVTLTVKVLRWKRYLQDKDFHFCHVAGKEIHQGVLDALSRLCENHMPPKQGQETLKEKAANLSALQLKQHLTNELYDKIAAVHNSSVGHRGQAKCILKLDDPSVTDRMISTFIRQCPCCQVMSRLKIQIKTHAFTCALYLPFELINLDHRVHWQVRCVTVTIHHHHHHHHLRRILESYGILSEWMKLTTKR